jgi:outer membrane protein, heavy metal efflux system
MVVALQYDARDRRGSLPQSPLTPCTSLKGSQWHGSCHRLRPNVRSWREFGGGNREGRWEIEGSALKSRTVGIRRVAALAGGALLLTLFAFAFPGYAEDREISIDEAVAIALDKNPDYAAAARELTVARAELERANYVSQFNPTLESSGDYKQRQDRSNSQDWRVGLSQQLEIFGQPSLRRQSARFGFDRTSADLGNQARLLTAAVKLTFYESVRARSETDLFSELAELDRKLNDAGQTRLVAGEISQIDANLARVRYGESERALIESRTRYRLERSSLGRLLGAAAGFEPEPRGSMTIEPLRVDLNKLLDIARRNRPDYRSAQLEVGRLKNEVLLNERLALPNPTIGAFGAHENNTEHFAGITLGIPLPIFNRRQAEATAIAGKLAQAKDRQRAIELDLEREVRDAWQRYASAVEVVSVNQREVLQPARESFELLEEAFTAGKLDLLRLSLAERQAFEARIGYVRAWFDLVAARVAVELALGGQL